jgi:hypothetical protein
MVLGAEQATYSAASIHRFTSWLLVFRSPYLHAMAK